MGNSPPLTEYEPVLVFEVSCTHESVDSRYPSRVYSNENWGQVVELGATPPMLMLTPMVPLRPRVSFTFTRYALRFSVSETVLVWLRPGCRSMVAL